MKNRLFISMMSALFVIGLSSSCDLFDKADDVSFTSEFEESFNVIGAEGLYAETKTLDATSDPEVNKYKEKIQEITINKITYKLTNYDGPDGATFTGDVLFGPSGSLGSVSISGLNLSSASASGAETDLGLSQDAVNKVAEQLKNDKAVSVTMSGTFSDGPVSFTMVIKINAKITANALS